MPLEIACRGKCGKSAVDYRHMVLLVIEKGRNSLISLSSKLCIFQRIVVGVRWIWPPTHLENTNLFFTQYNMDIFLSLVSLLLLLLLCVIIIFSVNF